MPGPYHISDEALAICLNLDAPPSLAIRIMNMELKRLRAELAACLEELQAIDDAKDNH